MTGTHWPHPPGPRRIVHTAPAVNAPSEAFSVPDPMARPHVDVSTPAFGGSIRLHSASGGLESLWIHLRDPEGREVFYDPATSQHRAASARLTPADARALSGLLRRYADTHKETT